MGVLGSKNGIEPLCPKVGGLPGEAIDCGPARLVLRVTKAPPVLSVHNLCAGRLASAVVGNGSLAYHDDGPRELILPRDSPG